MPTDGSSQGPPTPSPSGLEEGGANSLLAHCLHNQSTSLVSTTVCANCERRFAGNYCPTCGQKADAELSVTDIIGGFFRDFLDVNRGLWPTLKGLTIAPGRTLRHYLNGTRKQYVNPGRYLLIAALFQGLAIQLERWLGTSEAGFASASSSPDGAVEAALSFQTTFLEQSPGYYLIVLNCIFAGFLSLLYRQLFTTKTRSRASAVAIAVFVGAHGLILMSTIEVGWRLSQLAALGTYPAAPIMLTTSAMLGYAGIATYRCFESHWTDGLKAALAVGWAALESVSMIPIVAVGLGIVLSIVDPVSYPLSGMALGAAVFFLLLSLIPFLLHAGVAAYTRSR